MSLRFTIILGVLLISLAIPTEQIQEIRWVPGRWCGAHPPYVGTLFIGMAFGFPFSWIDVGRYEKCTTVVSIIDDYVFHPTGFMLNLLIAIIIGLLFTAMIEDFMTKDDST